VIRKNCKGKELGGLKGQNRCFKGAPVITGDQEGEKKEKRKLQQQTSVRNFVYGAACHRMMEKKEWRRFRRGGCNDDKVIRESVKKTYQTGEGPGTSRPGGEGGGIRQIVKGFIRGVELLPT